MKLEELLTNEEFLAAVENAASDQELIAVFAQYGVEVTEEMLAEAKAELYGELDENGLDEVAGGVIKLAPLIRVLTKSIVLRIAPKK